MPELKIHVVDELKCPTCGSPEIHPRCKDWVLIRAFKVGDANGRWWSQCLVCAGYYDKTTLEINLPRVKDQYGREVPVAFNANKGWF